MQPNVIYLSDASFDPDTGHAGIGIKNLSSGQTHSLSLCATGVNEAEEMALICAIEHALLNNHRNSVFVYDNINIDTEALKGFYAPMFEKIQFMWFKREYLKTVDRLASQARPKKEKLPHLALLESHLGSLSEQMLVAMFMPLARGDTYGFLCSISQAAPFYKELPKGMNNANKLVLSLLRQLGSKTLRDKLHERFGNVHAIKRIALDNFLREVRFDESWIEDARNECRALVCA
ncbi:MAG: hypothetical protein JU82_00410 [Sulfuricurvum sp. MLSB]|uniref:hypothetical protein n=1 Tax=unclassified Sulfuricurvum TaxID=2632390 RepID=UPI0005049649|nr:MULTISPECIES: hypothetical protein [unclassified Sulfuricurvum]KFN40876.1 MAG: hypothetical protein JU82_00410 [Sulfuricurvum sp. MLSB]